MGVSQNLQAPRNTTGMSEFQGGYRGPPLGLLRDSSDKLPKVPSIVLQAYMFGFRVYHLGWTFRP